MVGTKGKMLSFELSRLPECISRTKICLKLKSPRPGKIVPLSSWRGEFHVLRVNKITHMQRISFWHLLINLKNNHLFKKLLKWASKICQNFNIYYVVFNKK